MRRALTLLLPTLALLAACQDTPKPAAPPDAAPDQPALAVAQPEDPTRGTTAISAGYKYTCAVIDGAAKCWGRHKLHDPEDKAPPSANVPEQIEGLSSGVTRIHAGYSHRCAVHHGAAKCWGTNYNGELGDGTTTHSATPVQVEGLTSGVTEVRAGTSYSCAMHEGVAKCWGESRPGGSAAPIVNAKTPVPVKAPLDGFSGPYNGLKPSGAGGYGRTCILDNGAAKCLGGNASGELGDGTTTDSKLPVQVQGLSAEVSAIAIGDSHTCAIHAGRAKCWGANDAGQLGDGTNTNRLAPVAVLLP